MKQHHYGLVAVISAYTLWGLLPIYWKFLASVSAVEIFAHRIIWSFTLTLLLYKAGKRHPFPLSQLFQLTTLLCLSFTAILLGINWLLYIWAVNNGHVIEASLGYFINPLLAVLLGVVILHEKIRKMQILAVLVALVGVLYMSASLKHVPWVALSLAATFSIYTLLRKTSSIPPLDGLLMEMGILTLPSLLALAFFFKGQGEVAFIHGGATITTLLIGAGAVTVVPLLLFISGARAIPLISVGLTQYLAPTINFMLGIFYFHEPFPREEKIGFAFIWVALLLYSVDQIFRLTRGKSQLLQ